MELKLTDEEAQELLKRNKQIEEKVVLDLRKEMIREVGYLKDSSKHNYRIQVFINQSKLQIHFMCEETYHTLCRVDVRFGDKHIDPIDRDFHKNADGSYVRGNRVLLFSAKEHWMRQNNKNRIHYRAYSLPYDIIPNSEDISEVIEAFLDFTNVRNKSMIQVINQKRKKG